MIIVIESWKENLHNFSNRKRKKTRLISLYQMLCRRVLHLFSYSSLWPAGLVEDDKPCWTHFFLYVPIFFSHVELIYKKFQLEKGYLNWSGYLMVANNDYLRVWFRAKNCNGTKFKQSENSWIKCEDNVALEEFNLMYYRVLNSLCNRKN